MSIRQPAAEKLVRQLLELRLYRAAPLSDKFFTAMAKIVMAHVDIDEQHQRTERILESTAERLLEATAALDTPDEPER